MQNVIDRKHLDDPDTEALPLLGPGCGHEPVRLDAPRQPPDPARALARDEEHAATRTGSPDTHRLLRRPDRRLLRDQAVLRLRLHDDHVQLPRPRDARVLAGADGPGRRGPDLRAYGAPIIPDREPELGRPGDRDPLLDRPSAPPRPAGLRAHGRRDRRLLALHARRHARGDQLRLRAHRPRQGPERAQGDDEARAPERADPTGHARRARLRHDCSAAPSSPRPSSRSTAWGSTSSMDSSPTTPIR